MNVYEKLQVCRLELQKKNLKKSGENKFAGYDYFELGDFLPTINELFVEHKLFSKILFSEEMATLTIINTEKVEETIVFTSPMKDVTLKGAHSIQNLGAVQTYSRRYLYLVALEIVENDSLDATQGKDKDKDKDKPKQTYQKPNNGQASLKPLSEPQKKMILDKLGKLAKKYNLAVNEIIQKKMDSKEIPKPIEQLTSSEASALIKKIDEWSEK
jgi:hypothetical protein